MLFLGRKLYLIDNGLRLLQHFFRGGGKMETQKQEQLNVYMLGGFSVQYLGKEILLGRKNTLKFIQLMQLIWLRGNKEISKKN